MRNALIAALMLSATVTATASDAPMEEIVVTGEYPGPGMWQVTHPDHPGHTLWNALAMTTPVPTDLREQMDEMWFAAAGRALTKNESTLAFVPLSTLLGEQGYLNSLRERGYEILAPG